MRSRSAVRLVIVITALSAAVGAAVWFASSDAPEPSPSPEAGGHVGSPDPPKAVIWESRYQAALGSLVTEAKRIKAAEVAFAADRQASPLASRDYLVSFSTAVQPRRLLTSLSNARDIRLRDLFLWWLPTPESTHPVTGQYAAANLGLPGASPDQVMAKIAGMGMPPLVYGITCRCSPVALVAWAAEDPDMTIRIVEHQGRYQNPLWPSDPLRDKIIETGGRYGRE